MQFPTDVIVITGLMVVSLIFLFTVMARLYRKAGPHQALIVYGFRGTRMVDFRSST